MGNWIAEHWGTLLTVFAGYSSTIVGVVMYARNQSERITVVEAKVAAKAESEAERVTDLKEHVDEKFTAINTRFDRLEDKLDGLFVPRSNRG